MGSVAHCYHHHSSSYRDLVLTPSNYSLSLYISGDADGEAVLVTKDSTYALIRSETSNAMLVREDGGGGHTFILGYSILMRSFWNNLCDNNESYLPYSTLAILQQVASPPGFGRDSSTTEGIQVIVANCPSVIELEKCHTTVSSMRVFSTAWIQTHAL